MLSQGLLYLVQYIQLFAKGLCMSEHETRRQCC
jgi:hypothetical protein